MSPNPYPLFVISQNDKPEQIEIRTGLLIRLYLKDNNSFIAEAVVEHINALLSFPAFIVDIEQRCALRRLAMHWHCLAWIERDKSEHPAMQKMKENMQ
ncbi:MAG: ATP dependent RNA helicase [Methyloprofundus sp.]|nr:ATP dependent RNA helicase [Methyloprofundus sp.]